MDTELADFIAICGRMPDQHSPFYLEADLAIRHGSDGHQHVVEDLFLLRLQHINLLKRTEHRWPSRSSDDPYEAKLGAWLAHVRTGRTPLGRRRASLLEVLAPGWQDPHETTWERRLMHLTAFVRDHARMPSRLSVDAFEASLNQWLTDQRKLQRRGKLRATREAMLFEAMSLVESKLAA